MTITIKAGEQNPDLLEYLQRHKYRNWAFITAWNPYSTSLALQINQERNKRLTKLLENNNLFYMVGLGVDPEGKWMSEESYLVFNIGKLNALNLAKKFEQNAILYGNLKRPPELLITDSV